ncbi:hypothetical protein JVT61DRAFT_7313 [Boletus reticuloceps]|uniref:Uncharacterized protein n=1 Tax=Boletus reticuloceps TaxID=495285 RepID=A0A8I3A5X3_9AGAM|nr:hypothetical protein JVT61DRAFT_7313 [Boletus reticuloceps]
MPRHAQTPHEHEHTNGGVACDHEREDEDDPIYTTRRTRSALELRAQAASTRFAPHLPRATGLSVLLGEGLGWRKPKITQITTAPGQLGAGETETEADEPVSSRVTLYPWLQRLVARHSKGPLSTLAQPSHLPTTRIMPVSEPLVPPSVVTMVLFESSRLLSVVPAAFGVLLNAWCLSSPPGYASTYGSSDHYDTRPKQRTQGWGRPCPPDRGDYLIAVLWALLTAHQCLKLTTGLLHRWRAYYSPLSTLIRLLALQAICWPATHLTLGIVGSLGTNAGDDDSLTMLESALLRWTTARPDICWAVIGTTTSRSNVTCTVSDRPRPRRGAAGEETRKLMGRKWDWGIVARVCMLPAGCLYFVMVWIGAWRREVGGC